MCLWGRGGGGGGGGGEGTGVIKTFDLILNMTILGFWPLMKLSYEGDDDDLMFYVFFYAF